MKMLNGNISCIDLDSEVETVKNNAGSDVYVPTKNKAYRRLQVVNADENSIESGKEIYVPLNSGNEVTVKGEEYVVVNIRNVILIVD